MSRMFENKIKRLPDSPGIYLFYNSQKELIYVGKATSLRNRVASYFRFQITDLRLQNVRPIEAMVHEIKGLKAIKTNSVLEAVILEGNYIKKFRPKYNVMWRDDKSWNYICITKDIYPRVELVREHEMKNFKFQISNFKLTFGPYPGLNTKEMMKLLRKLFFVSTCNPPHPNPLLIKERERGKALSLPRRGEGARLKPCFYHQLGQCLGVCTGEISSSDYKKKVIKPLILFLSGKTKAVVKDLQKLMKEAAKKHEFEEAGRIRDQIRQLQRIQDVALLNQTFVKEEFKIEDLRFKIDRIEGYDISNLGASGKVGSMVVFENGEPKKSDYRKFKIKTVVGQSDVDCLSEVLERRLKHNEWSLPEVFLIDGGVPQVNVVMKRLKDQKIERLVVGIAKGPERKKNEFILGSKDREFVKWVNANKDLLIRVRDEAHRFAINYQRKLRKLK